MLSVLFCSRAKDNPDSALRRLLDTANEFIAPHERGQIEFLIKFDEDDDGCVWNIRVDWQSYDEAVLWKNVNLCKMTALRLRYDPGTKTTSFLAE